MSDLARSFPHLLAGYRHRQGLSQQEAATIAHINASELSKAERGVKKRLQVDAVLRLIEGLKLSRKEAREFLEAAGYTASILDRVRFNPRNYPIATGIIQERLHGSHGFWPVYQLSTDGTIIAANLLAFRLWRGLEETDTSVNPTILLGENIFKVFVRPENLTRIAMPEKESDFWYSVFAVWKKLKDTVPSSTVKEFEEAIEAHPILKLLLRYGTSDIEREWEQDLRIYPSVGPASLDEPKVYLEFHLLVERIMTEQEHTGYLVTAQPLGKFTIDRTQREYLRLINLINNGTFKGAFVQPEPAQPEVDIVALEEEEKYPPFFPAVHLDLLGRIIFENTLFLRLFDPEREFEDKHFFDMLFSPRMLTLMGGFYLKTMSIPVRRFLERTKEFAQQQHKLHEDYIAIKAHLLQQDSFTAVLSDLFLSRATQSSMQHEETTYHIETACPFTDTFRLSFEIVERLPLRTVEDYRVAFVPTNNATKAALILLRLEDEEDYRAVINSSEDMQLLYLLAVLRTIQEGLTKQKGKKDWSWHPEAFMKKIDSLITEEVKHNGNNPLEGIKRQLTWALTQLLLSNVERQEGMLTMLNKFTEPIPYAHAFLAQDRSPRATTETPSAPLPPPSI